MGRKIWLEFKDILAGVAFPFMLSLVLSTTIILYASYSSQDLGVSLVALIGGELMLGAAFLIFGRANGSAAYKKTVSNAQKRELNSTDERVLCHTGEYALWKGVLIGFIPCIPFVIFQTIELIFSNVVCSFCLKYICGWAYYPFHYLGEKFQALNYVIVIFPVAMHVIGYHLGKLKQIKIQEEIAQTLDGNKRKKK